MKQHTSRYAGLTAALQRVDYSGKTILVTGGGFGMGVDMCRSFAARKAAQIVIVGRNAARVQTSAAELAEEYPETKFTPIAADISSQDDVKRLFASLDSSPAVLVNNAGYMPAPTPFLEIDMDDWWAGYQINVYGSVNVSLAYLRHRAAQPSVDGPGVVITLNTIAAYHFPLPALSAYASSKAALARWSECVSVDVPAETARFISLHPGAVMTSMGERAGVIDSLVVTEASLTGDFTAWLGSEEASFLAGRFVWANWDCDELLARKQEIVEKEFYKTALNGAETLPWK
ncbi:NAD(P)-binding protein [Trichoderma citrinoviride]|uniref:NAD(P)-binding protein n=1 Tax=Trichoderma citrinoviride TaxID=58853 RepID=A0A2T4AXK0_9HYPO|nr:NAD(P)-binding protein [Trichoderma citrinoviride]PTB61681.1 NAD(P)-binding protein [Trichoderma citrinoviride]